MVWTSGEWAELILLSFSKSPRIADFAGVFLDGEGVAAPIRPGEVAIDATSRDPMIIDARDSLVEAIPLLVDTTS